MMAMIYKETTAINIVHEVCHRQSHITPNTIDPTTTKSIESKPDRFRKAEATPTNQHPPL
jgi:hypothetical protein